jgi:hypothetical protein
MELKVTLSDTYYKTVAGSIASLLEVLHNSLRIALEGHLLFLLAKSALQNHKKKRSYNGFIRP